MADRYWVGGTGSWNATTTNWSATNGGAGGASVPTASDDVFFTTLSNATAYVVTLATAPICRSVSVVGPAVGNVTIAGTANWSVYGSFTLAATGVTFTYTTGIISFLATTTGFTITTNGNSLNAAFINFNGAGGAWTLGSALTNTNSFQVLAGTVSTANFNVTTGNLLITGAVARTVTLGSSSVTCISWNVTGSNTTVNAGTSTITLTGGAGTFFGGGLTYYNVTKASNGFAINDGGNTFNALTNATVTVSGTFICSFAGNQTIGTLTVNGSATTNGRASIQTTAALAGTQVTLTVASFVTNGNIDFRDINFAGAASPLTVATGGDAGNNTNITLQAPKTVYWNAVAGGVWGLVAWATTSGGAPAAANYPLPQDTVIIDDVGLSSGNTITLANNVALGALNMSTRTLPMTLAVGTSGSPIYGDLTLSSAVAITSTTGLLAFSGYNKTQTITSAGVTIDAGITVGNLSTTTTISGALTLGTTKTFTLTLGTLNLANNTLTCGLFSTSNSNTRAITFGTGQINLTSNAGTIWNFNISTNLTITGSAIVNATYSGATGTRLFLGPGPLIALINVNITAGTDIVAISNSGFNNLNFTGFTGSVITSVGVTGNLTLGAGMTVTSSSFWYAYGTSGIQQFTSNGVTLDAPFSFIGVGGTVQLQDNLTVGATRTVTLTSGTFNLNGQTASIGLFTSTGAGVRSIAFNGGTINVSGATFTASGSNLTTSGSGTINMTSASSKTFAGGGFSYPTLNQGGAGALVITGANTFANMTNTVQPATITFPASTTTTVSAFNVNGTAGNLVTLNSSTPGTRFTLFKAVSDVVANYLSISDSRATLSDTWYAQNSTDGGNNIGWIFFPDVLNLVFNTVLRKILRPVFSKIKI
jgi:hypothetical protein